MFSPFRKTPNIDTSAQNAIREIEQIIAPYREAIALVREMSELELPEAQRDLLARTDF